MDGSPWGGTEIGSENQNGTEVIDIGARRAADNKVVKCTEKPVTVIVFQQRFGIEAERCGTLHRVGLIDGAGIVFRAVNAVGVAGNRVHAGGAVQGSGKAQQKLRSASAATIAG